MLTICLPANRLRADQVSIEEFRADPAKYTATVPRGPTLPVGSATIHKIPVKEPLGEIEVQVYVPTDDAIQTGGLKNADGKLPAYVNYHGGEFPPSRRRSSPEEKRDIWAERPKERDAH